MARNLPLPIIPAEVIRKFVSGIKFGAINECWTFGNGGYGTLPIGGKRYQASRVAFQMFRGSDPVTGIICHHCDNPPCVNPNHLYVGNARMNTDDTIRRGRTNQRPKGSPGPKQHLHPDFLTAASKESQ
jgi:hypothetical protein